MLVMAALVASVPFMLMIGNLDVQSSVTSAHDDAASRLVAQQREQERDEAIAYNRKLFEDGQTIMGDATDPFSTETNKSGDKLTIADKDEFYQAQLDTPTDGIMATVRYPRLDIELPIRHGTGASVLADGAGHMYGTSLPVGGENTHAVISAHSGLSDRLMFDKLSMRQAQQGDFFYITVLGEDLAYKVTSIKVVEPDQFDDLRIVPGEDQVTLLTCTPYGVNTQRILVTGTRAAIPKPAPALRDARRGHTKLLLIAAIVLVWLLIAAIIMGTTRRRRLRAGRHARDAGVGAPSGSGTKASPGSGTPSDAPADTRGDNGTP